MSALVERIIAYRDDLRIGRSTMVRPTMDLMAEAANALDNYEKTMRVIVEQTDPASVAMNRARKALAAWDRYEPHLTSEGIVCQANDMANAIRDILSAGGVKLPPQPDEAREGSQSPDDGRAPGIGQNPSETTTPNTEHRV